MDFFEYMTRYLLDNKQLEQAVNNRLYPLILPQKPKLPSIVYTPLSVVYDDGLQAHTGFIRQKVQFTVHNTTFGNTRAVGRVLKNVLQDFMGDMAGLHIQATHTINDLSADGGSANYKEEEYSNILEFEFNYMESGA